MDHFHEDPTLGYPTHNSPLTVFIGCLLLYTLLITTATFLYFSIPEILALPRILFNKPERLRFMQATFSGLFLVCANYTAGDQMRARQLHQNIEQMRHAVSQAREHMRETQSGQKKQKLAIVEKMHVMLRESWKINERFKKFDRWIKELRAQQGMLRQSQTALQRERRKARNSLRG
ncbi:hypothetical protein EJ04DRAFT_592169 [Polyplosphaeria fusca]|uniref:Uncharacterized protein n=1 Tax=Polyplosphaeria fusca TaxID=682080 RepID=A0A9P4UWU5_9PLEO|nr:hypothetical protein EJ04DRAFT_592169 [Polyplosphaeria fusca]